MAFNWRNYVSLADELTQNAANIEKNGGDIQALIRAALSRAYYGLFQSVYNYLRDVENDFCLNMPILQKNRSQTFSREDVRECEKKTARIHEYVSGKLNPKGDKKDGLRKGVKQVLDELKQRRVQADYKEDLVFSLDTVRLAIRSVHEACGYLDKLCNGVASQA
jgi:hypothetical protein